MTNKKSTEKRTETHACDLISRQAAIDGKISIQCANGVEIYSDEAVPVEYLKALPSAQPELDPEALIRTIEMGVTATNSNDIYSLGMRNGMRWCKSLIDGVEPKFEDYVTSVDDWKKLPSAQPETEKYEYHYDHTDCIWYRPEARNRCPVTCAQYRDGWNDAMNYIFRDGKGYMPYRRDKQYER